MGCVAGQQHSSDAVGRGLASHVGEPGDPGGVVDAEVGAVHGDERFAQITQGGLAARPELLLVTTTRTVFPSFILWRPWTPAAS